MKHFLSPIMLAFVMPFFAIGFVAQFVWFGLVVGYRVGAQLVDDFTKD